MRLLLISDTHIPTRARDLPARVWDEVDAADVVIHAGDWMDPALLDALEQRSARLLACWGNNDDGQAPGDLTGTWTELTAGLDHSCGIRTDGTATCWGEIARHGTFP